MSAHPFLDDAQVAVVREAIAGFKRDRAWPSRWVPVSAIVDQWATECAAAESVLALLDTSAGSRIAGPFEPVDLGEWCTAHACFTSDETCAAKWFTSSPSDCNLVTLYIEVQA